MKTFPFNIVVLDKKRIPVDSLRKVADILGRSEGIRLGEDTYLALGDYTTLVLALFPLPGCGNGQIKLYSLSAFDGELGGADGIHTTIRKQAHSHLRFELGRLGLELPSVLKEETK
ncbi:MAG: hypothetical protein ABSB84_03125 [Verrucomicrobiota bacterium]|jgi:hypothetical protein